MATLDVDRLADEVVRGTELLLVQKFAPVKQDIARLQENGHSVGGQLAAALQRLDAIEAEMRIGLKRIEELEAVLGGVA